MFRVRWGPHIGFIIQEGEINTAKISNGPVSPKSGVKGNERISYLYKLKKRKGDIVTDAQETQMDSSSLDI